MKIVLRSVKMRIYQTIFGPTVYYIYARPGSLTNTYMVEEYLKQLRILAWRELAGERRKVEKDD